MLGNDALCRKDGGRLNVGGFEGFRVFEAVAEEPVEGDMGDPDDGNLDGVGDGGSPADERQQRGNQIGVRPVIKSGWDARMAPDEISQERQVRSEEEDGEKKPMAMEGGIANDAGQQHGGGFQAQDQGGSCQHGESLMQEMGQ